MYSRVRREWSLIHCSVFFDRQLFQMIDDGGEGALKLLNCDKELNWPFTLSTAINQFCWRKAFIRSTQQKGSHKEIQTLVYCYSQTPPTNNLFPSFQRYDGGWGKEKKHTFNPLFSLLLRWVYTNLLLCVQTQQEIDIMWQNTMLHVVYQILMYILMNI